jgi:hypothetical protein
LSKNRLENIEILSEEILGTLITFPESRVILDEEGYEHVLSSNPVHAYLWRSMVELQRDIGSGWDHLDLSRHIVSKGSDSQTTAFHIDRAMSHSRPAGDVRGMVEEAKRLKVEQELADLGQKVADDPEEVDYNQLIEVAEKVHREPTTRPYVYTSDRARALASSPPPDNVVSGLLHRGHVTVLSAPPYSGKSWFALNIASAVSSIDEARSPAPWPGSVLECHGSRVVYLSPDFPASELARRLRKLDQMRGDLVRADSYWDNIYLVGDAPGVLLPRGVYDLSDEGTLRIIDELIPEDASLLIIDTLSASLPDNVTENDNAGMAKVMGHVQKIASRKNIAVLLIHHTSKPTKGSSDTEVWASVRGAGAISGSASSNALLEGLEDPSHSHIRRLRVVSNVSSGMPTTYFEVRPQSLRTDEILYWRPVPDPELSDRETLIGADLKLFVPKEWAHLNTVADSIVAVHILPNFDRALHALKQVIEQWANDGLIDRRRKGQSAWEIRLRPDGYS